VQGEKGDGLAEGEQSADVTQMGEVLEGVRHAGRGGIARNRARGARDWRRDPAAIERRLSLERDGGVSGYQRAG
jgi:hypothetical protein